MQVNEAFWLALLLFLLKCVWQDFGGEQSATTAHFYEAVCIGLLHLLQKCARQDFWV